MAKWFVFPAALLLGISSLAIAQTSSTNPSTTGGVNAPAAATGGAATSPSRSLSGSSRPGEAQIKQKLESSGYSQIQLHENAANQWNGTAMKNGRQVNIDVTPDGSVVEK
jgi:hypothetical protein